MRTKKLNNTKRKTRKSSRRLSKKTGKKTSPKTSPKTRKTTRKTTRKITRKSTRKSCSSKEDRLLLELVKSSKLGGYRQDGAGIMNYLKDYLKNPLKEVVKKSENNKNNFKLNITTKHDIRSLQEKLDTAISKYRYHKEQEKLAEEARQNQDGGNNYQLSEDVQVGGEQQQLTDTTMTSDNSHTFDNNSQPEYSAIYGGGDNEKDNEKEIPIFSTGGKHRKWMDEVGAIKKNENIGFFQALKVASKARKEKKALNEAQQAQQAQQFTQLNTKPDVVI